MIDIDALETLAKAATPGEWISYTPIGAALNPWEATFVAGPIPRYMDRSQGFCPADGNYIGAANPQVVLALIAEVRALRNLESAVRDHRAMYEGTSDEDNMSALSIGDAIAKLDAVRKEKA
jgi:hypothetical protein